MVSHLLIERSRFQVRNVGFLYPMFRQDGHRTQRVFGLQIILRRKIFNYLDPHLVRSPMENREDQIYLQIR
jgi:hypothetical protein